MKKLSVGIVGAIGVLPMLAFAGLNEFIAQLNIWIGYIIPLLISFAVVLFLWGLVKFVANASDEGKRQEGKDLMIWGLIALFVMIAFWGIVGWIQTTLDLNNTAGVIVGPSGTGNVLPT